MAGAGYKLFTTGQVLTAAEVNTYLMEQTIMVFNNAAARDTALSGVLAQGMQCFLKDTNTMQYYSGSAWVTLSTGGDITSVTAGTGISGGGTSGDVTITNSMATAITTKGDLVPGTGSGTFSRLAAGNNGETLVADSSTSTGLRWQGSYAAGKNFLINGDMSIAQRGTSSALLTNGYRLDRWAAGTNQSANFQQVTTGSTTVPAYYALRAGSVTNAQVAGGARVNLTQQIESLLAQNLAGQTVTLSFWVKFSAASISGAGNWQYYINTSTSADPAISSSFGTNAALGNITNGSFPTTWTKYSITGTIGTTARAVRATFEFPNLFTTTNANDAYYDITAVQLEIGSTATGFTLAGGTLAGELAACQRYYYRMTSVDADPYMHFFAGTANTTSNFRTALPIPTTMRVYPSSIEYGGSFIISDGASTFTGGAVTLQGPGKTNTGINIAATGLTQFRPYLVYANNSNATYIGLNAEL